MFGIFPSDPVRKEGAALLPGERLDDLQCGGYRLIQRTDAFRFGTDSVLLADFAAPRPHTRAVDLGCGTGAIATLMAAHEPTLCVDAVEIQHDIAGMARRSVLLNGLEQRMRVFTGDMRQAHTFLGYGQYALAVCNPPYGRAGAALPSKNESVRMARHECGLTPDGVAESAARLIKNGGRLCVIFPAPRALEMMRSMEDHGIAPKRVRTVHGMPGRAPKFVLIEGIRGGGSGLNWLPPLVLREEDGSFSAEWKRIYRIC